MSGVRSKVHTFAVTVRLDKPCTAEHARRQAANCIHGQFYPDAFRDGDPELLTIRSWKPMPRRRLAAVRQWLSEAAP